MWSLKLAHWGRTQTWNLNEMIFILIAIWDVWNWHSVVLNRHRVLHSSHQQFYEVVNLDFIFLNDFVLCWSSIRSSLPCKLSAGILENFKKGLMRSEGESVYFLTFMSSGKALQTMSFSLWENENIVTCKPSLKNLSSGLELELIGNPRKRLIITSSLCLLGELLEIKFNIPTESRVIASKVWQRNDFELLKVDQTKVVVMLFLYWSLFLPSKLSVSSSIIGNHHRLRWKADKSKTNFSRQFEEFRDTKDL